MAWSTTLLKSTDSEVILQLSAQHGETATTYTGVTQTHLASIINGGDDGRTKTIDDVFINYENYSYLKKTFDSSDYNFENKIIILKIDYSIFDKQLKTKGDS